MGKEIQEGNNVRRKGQDIFPSSTGNNSEFVKKLMERINSWDLRKADGRMLGKWEKDAMYGLLIKYLKADDLFNLGEDTYDCFAKIIGKIENKEKHGKRLTEQEKWFKDEEWPIITESAGRAFFPRIGEYIKEEEYVKLLDFMELNGTISKEEHVAAREGKNLFKILNKIESEIRSPKQLIKTNYEYYNTLMREVLPVIPKFLDIWQQVKENAADNFHEMPKISGYHIMDYGAEHLR